MAQVLVESETLTNIADSIRSVNGEETSYYPSEMASAISAFSVGSTGTITTLISDTISEATTTYSRALTSDEISAINYSKWVRLIFNTNSSVSELPALTFGIYFNYGWPMQACSNTTLGLGNNTQQIAMYVGEWADDNVSGLALKLAETKGVSTKVNTVTPMYGRTILKNGAQLKATTTLESGFPVGTTMIVDVIA